MEEIAGEYTCLYPLEKYTESTYETSYEKGWGGLRRGDETFLPSFIKARETFSSRVAIPGFHKIHKMDGAQIKRLGFQWPSSPVVYEK